MYCQIYRFSTVTQCSKQLQSLRRNISWSAQSTTQRNQGLEKMDTALNKNIITTTSKICKSPEDKRLYRGLKLANGLKVLLVSDPTTDKSAAALAVQVGYMSDPDNIPGLAHFCEHMLFLGTSKFPDENSYTAFLSENGGSSNAATYPDNTKYFFEVVPDKLKEGLDRFSQFFIAPLFTESATEREINAVNSEYEKNLSTDVWRIEQVKKTLSDPKHPYSKFGTGNAVTLQQIPAATGINVRNELIKFHKKWYSANIMHLSVFGKESLDELEEMILTYFSKIENKNIETPRWTAMPIFEESLATKTMIIPVKDTRSLTISFPTGDLDVNYKAGPQHYISHLIGHEGVGSILSELKIRGWSNNLMGGNAPFARGFGFFEVTVDLTEEGLEHVDDVIKIIFQYIMMLNNEEPKKWIFEEYCNLNEMQFRFKDKDHPLTLVSSIVHAMQIFPIEEVLSAPYLITDWRPDLIDDLLKTFIPSKALIYLVSQKLKPMAKKREKWFNTEYDVVKIDSQVLNDWSKCGKNENLNLPEPNLFIATDFSLLPLEKDALTQKVPLIIHDTPIMRVWFKQDTDFRKPKTIMNLDFSSPIVYSDPLNCNLTHLFVQLFKDELNEYLYAAELASLRLNITNTTNGISISISGYSSKQQILLEKALDAMFNFKINEQRFDILKEQYVRGLKNFNAEQPYQHAVYYLALLLTEQAWTKQELLEATSLLTIERLSFFIQELLSRMHAECFIYGNVNRAHSMELATLVENKLKKTNAATLPLLSRQLLLKREYKLCDRDNYLFEAENLYHKSSCAELYLQCGIQDDQSNILVDLVTQIISEPCYNVLRTKEQLGYIVYCGTRKTNGTHGIRVIVQSAKHPSFVEERIESFLDGMQDHLSNMSEEDFEKHKESLASIKLEKPKTLFAQFNRFLTEISLQQFHFDRTNIEVAFLRTVTKQQIIDYYNAYIHRDGPQRHVLSVHVVSTAEDGAGLIKKDDSVCEKRSSEPKMITDLATFKMSKELYPIAKPYINIQPKGAKSKL